jgi:HlyD family secretion protein
VRKAATNVANVVTYVAIVRFANVQGKLLPGMTANVRIVTEQRENVLKLPNAALRLRIEGVEPAPAPAPAPGAAASAPGARAQGLRPDGGAVRSANRSRVYVMGADGKPQAVAVRVGVSDGSSSELILPPNSPAADVLREGTEVLVGIKQPGSAASPRSTGPRPLF